MMTGECPNSSRIRTKFDGANFTWLSANCVIAGMKFSDGVVFADPGSNYLHSVDMHKRVLLSI